MKFATWFSMAFEYIAADAKIEEATWKLFDAKAYMWTLEQCKGNRWLHMWNKNVTHVICPSFFFFFYKSYTLVLKFHFKKICPLKNGHVSRNANIRSGLTHHKPQSSWTWVCIISFFVKHILLCSFIFQCWKTCCYLFVVFKIQCNM